MDRFVGTEVEGSANLNISKLNLISDAKSEETSIDFTKKPELLAATNYTGATSGLKALSPIYSYDVEYDKEMVISSLQEVVEVLFLTIIQRFMPVRLLGRHLRQFKAQSRKQPFHHLTTHCRKKTMLGYPLSVLMIRLI